MTLEESGSYTFFAIRLITATGLFALCSCATAASRTELVELNAQVRAMRAEAARLESRLEKLEQQVSVRGSAGPAQAARSSAKSAAPAPETNELPQLTVVKLKPKKEAAPRLETNVPIVEPPRRCARRRPAGTSVCRRRRSW